MELSLAALAADLDQFFASARFPQDQNGMLGDIPSTPLETFVALLTEAFTTPPEITETYARTVSRVAVVGAMNDALIREAAAQDVQLYITGQFRQPALRAVRETRMTVAIIGHTPSELWGLRALADLLQQRGLTALTAPMIL